MNEFRNRIIIGLVERIVVMGNKRKIEVNAKIDSGATKSSLDKGIADELNLGPVIKSKVVKSVHGSKVRPVIVAEILLANKKIKAEFTLADRIHMKYPVLIGQNILKKGFIIDPCKS